MRWNHLRITEEGRTRSRNLWHKKMSTAGPKDTHGGDDTAVSKWEVEEECVPAMCLTSQIKITPPSGGLQSTCCVLSL